MGNSGSFKKGGQRPQEWTDIQTAKVSDEKSYAWKGEQVSYRGLHQWIRRKKGHPGICTKCGKQSDRPRIIQWANIDGRYRRVLEDYVGMCCSCHKLHDRWLSGKATLDGKSASQLHFLDSPQKESEVSNRVYEV